MRYSRVGLVALPVVLAAVIAVTNCSGSGGNSSSTVPQPHPSASVAIGPNMYVANFASPGPNFVQFVPSFSSDSSPSLTIADDPEVFTAAASSTTVAEAGENTELGFFTQPLTGSSTPTVDTLSNVVGLIKLAFDPSGNLWGSAVENNEVLEFTPPFTATSTPALTVSDDVNNPIGLAFDASNNLYVVNEDEPSSTPSELLEFAQPYNSSPSIVLELPLLSSGADEAIGAAVFQNTLAIGIFENAGGAGVHGASAVRPRPLAFRRPNLWLDSIRERGHGARPLGVAVGGEILLYTLPLTEGSTPAVTIPDVEAGDLAFDSSGNLYVANETQGGTFGSVQVYTPPFSASSTPAFTITSGLSEPTTISFGD